MWRLAVVLAGCGIENSFAHQEWDDDFVQSPDDRADVLFVVDDSGSMAAKQDLLANGFVGFMAALEDTQTDFHLAVISTTWDENEPTSVAFRGSPPVLTPSDDYLRLFQDRVRVGTGGADMESGYEAAAMALSDEALGSLNRDFLRAGAPLAIVIVSDEDDCSDAGALAGEAAAACYQKDDLLPSADSWVDTLLDVKIDGGDLRIGAIIGTHGSDCDDVYPAVRYATGAARTDGRVADICEPDWGSLLGEMGLEATGLLTAFPLTHDARPETLEVWVDDVPVEARLVDGFTYEETSREVVFHGLAIPPRGSTVHVHYTVL